MTADKLGTLPITPITMNFPQLRSRSLHEYAVAAHKTAREHGFWDPVPSEAKLNCLMHSEISEALEDLRAGKGPAETWYERHTGVVTQVRKDCPEGDLAATWKPCGVPSEIADLLIRKFDCVGHALANGHAFERGALDDTCAQDSEALRGLWRKGSAQEDPLYWYLQKMHKLVDGCGVTSESVVDMVVLVEEFASFAGFDLWKIVNQKMTYNEGRPFKHGKKF
jgi:hypothetical protein